MIFNLFKTPIILLLGGFSAFLIVEIDSYFYLLQIIETEFSGSTKGLLLWVSFIMGTTGLFWLSFNGIRLYQWCRGRIKEEICEDCGGLTTELENADLGPYHHCLACGHNKSKRRTPSNIQVKPKTATLVNNQ